MPTLIFCYMYNYTRARIFGPFSLKFMSFVHFVPSGVPMMALTATVTNTMRKEVITSLDMEGCSLVLESPNRENIFYAVCRRTTIEEDFSYIVTNVRVNSIIAKRVIIYCRSLNMCADLYAHFLYTLGDKVIILNMLLKLVIIGCSPCSTPTHRSTTNPLCFKASLKWMV